jgi:spermidine synthase
MTSVSDLGARHRRLMLPLFLPMALVIFTVSGFAGLIYQSIWSHYLKLFLGHAAYAQTLVLAIFMGGMALGAWLASRCSPRWKDLILAYAVIEALVGLISLGFHPLFLGATAFAFESAIPALDSPLAAQLCKWSLAIALILPQSVLLGMTFPLMTGGVLRLRPERSGYAVAMLYFTNSLGAAVGVLASGFWLIESAGLPGTLAFAASMNLVAAAAAVLLPRSAPAAPAPAPVAAAGVPRLRLMLGVAALTGFSSFLYEIGWIRMLALVLGSSTHAFELMLSAFILGIACGGLWIRRRIDTAASTLRLLALAQIAMGIAAVATLPIYGASFHFMRELLAAVAGTEAGYAAFTLVSHGICLAVMFPAAFCAGMTLPLITMSLLRAGAGEAAIGQVYGANTLGSIAGVLVAVHLGLPLLGLKGLIIAGAIIDLALGVLLLALASQAPRRFAYAGAAAALGGTVLLVAALAVRLDAHDMASGVYRLGTLLDKQRDKLVFQADGKTATVSLTTNGEIVSLRTNGKIDAAISVSAGPPSGDEVTMTLMGALPQFLAPGARRIANIGFGSGMTASVLLASETIEALDTVEIEPAIVQAARRMGSFNTRALQDPRSRIHFEDARTFFASRHARYDVIVSEPSNPWVSGVASLFTTEFYRDLRRYLRDGGLLVQWVQIYELSPVLVATVVAALEENFSDYEVWLANTGDLIIVAANGGRVPALDGRAFDNPRLRADLERFHIRNLDDLRLHRIGGRAVLGPYFRAYGAPANSDFSPILDLKAPLARFMRAAASEIPGLVQAPLPVLRLFERPQAPPSDPARLSPGERPWWPRDAWGRQALAVNPFLLGDDRAAASVAAELAGDLALLRATVVECRLRPLPDSLPMQFANLARTATIYLPPAEAAKTWDIVLRSSCSTRLPPEVRRWARLHAATAAGDPASMAAIGDEILKAHPELRGELLGHALAAYMAGSILQGQGGAALQAYSTHRGRIAPAWRETFRLLVGQADFGMQFRSGDQNWQLRTGFGRRGAP